METLPAILSNFAACRLCGHFMASLLALLGDASLAPAAEGGPWLEFPWQPPIGEMLRQYYDWDFDPAAEQHSGHCPACLRRIVYQREESTASLQLERRPGQRL